MLALIRAVSSLHKLADIYPRSIQTRIVVKTPINLIQEQTYSTTAVVGVTRRQQASTLETIPSDNRSAF